MGLSALTHLASIISGFEMKMKWGFFVCLFCFFVFRKVA